MSSAYPATSGTPGRVMFPRFIVEAGRDQRHRTVFAIRILGADCVAGRTLMHGLSYEEAKRINARLNSDLADGQSWVRLLVATDAPSRGGGVEVRGRGSSPGRRRHPVPSARAGLLS